MSSTSNTINIAGSRKVLIAEYTVSSIFKIPDGVDLDDENMVKEYWVKYDHLTIKYTDGRTETYYPYYDGSDGDRKHPAEILIDDAENWGVEYSEDDEKAEQKGVKA